MNIKNKKSKQVPTKTQSNKKKIRKKEAGVLLGRFLRKFQNGVKGFFTDYAFSSALVERVTALAFDQKSIQGQNG